MESQIDKTELHRGPLDQEVFGFEEQNPLSHPRQWMKKLWCKFLAWLDKLAKDWLKDHGS